MINPDLPDTRYDYTHPWWQNANDRVAYERAFALGDFEERQVAQAMLSSNPSVPDAVIRAGNANAARVPSRFGYNMEEISISDILDNGARINSHIDDSHTTDFTGRNAETNGSSRPGIYW